MFIARSLSGKDEITPLEADLEPRGTSAVELFCENVNGLLTLTIFAKGPS